MSASGIETAAAIASAGGEGTRTLQDRALRLFIVLSAFFCVNAALAEFIGVKIFALEDTLGIAPLQWNLFGQTGSLNFTAGTLLWPVVFLMTDVINEFFGRRGVRLISWLAALLIAYGFVFAFAAIALAPAAWWVQAAQAQGVPDYQAAFAAIFGQGLWSIGGSLIAFMIGQLIDVGVFHRIRSVTGEKHIWLRATGSTAVSQLVDSFVVLYIAFVLGPQHWPIPQFLAIGSVNYVYKMLAAFAMIPLIYLLRMWIHRYLGEARARQLRDEAAAD
ncbi:queuosine precursor transporter [Lysobacter antibioticus]|uniref:queuosine precursor transporter n=1 Tax=Lysobacter TaxID=68 RepID=UPI00068DFC7D|nr:queuosine precursor transporter [Lysobacter antibioticus]